MALEEVPILNEVAAEAPARPAKRTKRDTGLNGGYWGSLSAPDSGDKLLRGVIQLLPTSIVRPCTIDGKACSFSLHNVGAYGRRDMTFYACAQSETERELWVRGIQEHILFIAENRNK